MVYIEHLIINKYQINLLLIYYQINYNNIAGEYCICKASDDLFYRGIVEDLITYDMATILCIDYGFKEKIHHNQIFKPSKLNGIFYNLIIIH